MGDKIKKAGLILCAGLMMVAPALLLYSKEMQSTLSERIHSLFPKSVSNAGNISNILTKVLIGLTILMCFMLLSYGLCTLQSVPSKNLNKIINREEGVKLYRETPAGLAPYP